MLVGFAASSRTLRQALLVIYKLVGMHNAYKEYLAFIENIYWLDSTFQECYQSEKKILSLQNLNYHLYILP
jgi:hypothetical protein